MRARLSFPDNLTQLNREELLYALSSINWTEEDKQRITRALAIKDLELCDKRIASAEHELSLTRNALLLYQGASNQNKKIRAAIADIRRKIELIQKRIHRYKARRETIINEYDI